MYLLLYTYIHTYIYVCIYIYMFFFVLPFLFGGVRLFFRVWGWGCSGLGGLKRSSGPDALEGLGVSGV